MDSVDTLEKDERVEETKTEEKQAPKTALAFEIAEDDEGFVFDSEADITPELVKNEPVTEQAIEEDEIKEEQRQFEIDEQKRIEREEYLDRLNNRFNRMDQ